MDSNISKGLHARLKGSQSEWHDSFHAHDFMSQHGRHSIETLHHWIHLLIPEGFCLLGKTAWKYWKEKRKKGEKVSV